MYHFICPIYRFVMYTWYGFACSAFGWAAVFLHIDKTTTPNRTPSGRVAWILIIISNVTSCPPHTITLHYITLSSFHTSFTPKVTSGASTKLSMSGIVCECKHMSFQLLFEQTGVGKFLETKRNFVRSKPWVRRKRSFFRRTFASIMEVRIEECSQIWVFLDRTDRRLPLPCRTGSQEHGRCAPDAYVRTI